MIEIISLEIIYLIKQKFLSFNYLFVSSKEKYALNTIIIVTNVVIKYH